MHLNILSGRTEASEPTTVAAREGRSAAESDG